MIIDIIGIVPGVFKIPKLQKLCLSAFFTIFNHLIFKKSFVKIKRKSSCRYTSII